MLYSALPLLATYLLLLWLLARPLSVPLARMIDGESARPLNRLEPPLLRLCGIDAREMGWRQYAVAILAFNLVGVLGLYALLRLQAWLPLNPQQLPGLAADLAFNTAVSFTTNTNWQAYAGESSLSHFSQMAGLAVQNFLSAATGCAVAFALIRGLARHASQTLGNAWVDLLRISLYLLLPLSALLALLLVHQGVIQTFAAQLEIPLLQPQAGLAHQTLPLGPVASQEAIKLLGTNGGGFFNANSAHPFENPTALSNLLEMLAIFLIPTALVLAFGRVAGDSRQGYAVLAAMTLIFVLAVAAIMLAEQQSNPLLTDLGLEQGAGPLQAGGNMEGKESRFGILASSLFAAITTAAASGAVNAMFDSFTPLGGLVPLLLIQLGEVVFGGIGSGFYGMLLFVLLTVFIAGLMIGRTPEYLGKKIEAFDMKMVSLAILIPPLLVLVGTALSLVLAPGRAGIFNPGPHGLSEVLYAFSSAANNNGSAFAGLGANSPYYNSLLALAMWLGRFGVMVPILALAGSLAGKKRQLAGQGTLPTCGPLFIGLLVGTVLLVGALTYVPALALGPLVEQLLLILA